jgi:hypothetical protein
MVMAMRREGWPDDSRDDISSGTPSVREQIAEAIAFSDQLREREDDERRRERECAEMFLTIEHAIASDPRNAPTLRRLLNDLGRWARNYIATGEIRRPQPAQPARRDDKLLAEKQRELATARAKLARCDHRIQHLEERLERMLGGALDGGDADDGIRRTGF